MTDPCTEAAKRLWALTVSHEHTERAPGHFQAPAGPGVAHCEAVCEITGMRCELVAGHDLVRPLTPSTSHVAYWNDRQNGIMWPRASIRNATPR